jgi:hypothetical protein
MTGFIRRPPSIQHGKRTTTGAGQDFEKRSDAPVRGRRETQDVYVLPMRPASQLEAPRIRHTWVRWQISERLGARGVTEAPPAESL